PGEPMEEVLAELGNAANRGVVIRLILDARMYRTYPRTADSLARLRNWNVRLVDFGRIAGGVQHAKYFLIDGSTSFLGSQNFDWRALKHIHELGILVRDTRVTRDFQQVFEMDWAAATPIGQKPDTTRRKFVAPPRRPLLPLPYRIVQAPGDTAEVWPSYSPHKFIPDTTLADLRRIVGLIDGARHEVVLQLLQYSPDSRSERDPAIDDALRRAAGRGVRVKMLISDWVTGGRGLDALQDLAKDSGVEVKLSTLPEWSGGYIPFARVEHNKYMVVDTLLTWVGTSNWEPGYFTASRNLALTTRHRGLAKQARTVFEISWTAPSAAPLDKSRKYEPRIRGEEPPPGKKKYGG
ncbi:MAG: phospholipase D-like domain-containing protein, partial [Candidatus Eisenbacteria bacterium]